MATPEFCALYDEAFSWPAGPELDSILEVYRGTAHGDLATVCEIGAGTGRFMDEVLLRVPWYDAVEPDPGMFELLQSRWQQLRRPAQARARAVQCDAVAVTRLSRTYDLVMLLTDTASYIRPVNLLEDSLRSLTRCLNPQGMLLLDVALWRGTPGERRTETWTVSRPGARRIDALCAAEVRADRIESNHHLVQQRVERIRIEECLNGARIRQADSYNVLHALTRTTLQSVLAHCGLRLAALLPFGSEVRPHVDTWDRAVAVARVDCH